jgi:hypothetical protein
VASAVTLSGTTERYTAESLIEPTAVQSADNVRATTTLGPLLISGREALVIAFSKAVKGDASGGVFSPPATLDLDYSSHVDRISGVNTFATNATFAFAGFDGSTLTYIKTDNDPGLFGTFGAGTYATGAIDLSGLDTFFTASGLTDTSVNVSILTGRGGTALGSGSRTILQVLGSQLESGSMDFAKTIDVESLKKKFDNGSSASTSDTDITLSVDTQAIAAVTGTVLNTQAFSSIGFTITGDDFSWLDSTPTNTAAFGTGNLSITGAGNSISALTATTISGVLGSNSAFTGAINIDNGEDLVIPTQSGFTVDFVAYTKTDDEQVPLAGTVTGSWVLNGSSIDVYAVPQNASVFMWLTNTGTGSVGIDTTIFDGTQTCEMTNIATSVAGTELDLSAAIAAATPVQCPSYVASGNRVRYNVSASAPEASIRISAAYRVGTDRVNLLTSSEAGL